MTEIITAANICDESVSLKAGGSIPRYTCNGAFQSDSDLFDVAKGILSSFAGKPTLAGGKIGCVAGAWVAPTIHLDDGDFVGELSVPWRRSRRELFNCVKGRFHNPDLNYQEDSYPAFKDAQYISEDGQEHWTTFDLPFTNHPAIATRLAKIQLERHRHAITPSGSYKLSGYLVQPTNTVYLSHPRYHWVNKTFEVAESTLSIGGNDQGPPAIGVQLTLAETSPEVYAWNPSEEEGTATTHATTGIPDPASVALPTNLTLLSGMSTAKVRSDGIVSTRIKATWTPPNDPYVLSGGYTEVWVLPSGGSYHLDGYAKESQSEYWIEEGLADGTSYTIKLVAVNSYGAKSDSVTASVTASSTTSHFTGVVGGATYTDGTGIDALKPAEAGAQVTNGKSLTVLVDRHFGNISDTNDRKARTALHTNYTIFRSDGTAVLEAQATSSGVGKVIVHPFTNRCDHDVSCLSSDVQITGLTAPGRWYIYYDDANFAGGSITPQATQDIHVLESSPARWKIGEIDIPEYHSGGGTPETFRPTTYTDFGSWVTNNPANAYDNVSSTFSKTINAWDPDAGVGLPGDIRFTGFGNRTISSPSNITLYVDALVVGKSSCVSHIDWSSGSGSGTLANLTTTGSRTTYSVSLSTATATSTIQVRAFTDEAPSLGQAGGYVQIYEIWCVVTP